MTPAARIAAAIEILDRVLAGDNAERCLTTWARGNRFAGSKDRRAIRDHVFDALRGLRSCAWLGGAGDVPLAQLSGRALMIGALRAAEIDPPTMFTGAGYAPAPLRDDESAAPDLDAAPRGVKLDCPDALIALFDDALGAKSDAALQVMRGRADLFLRVNIRKSTIGHAIELLAEDGVVASKHGLSETALIVTKGARTVARSQAYLTGCVELQDAGSQALSDMVPLDKGDRVLDYCAGGGGKSLALAARADLTIDAHDIDPSRMQDIPTRASRAGVTIRQKTQAELASDYDAVICDVPCSGSGAWARVPQAKWLFTTDRLAALVETQSAILDEAAALVKPGGYLAYLTCSLFEAENASQIAAFMARNPGFTQVEKRLISPLEGGDGFFGCILRAA